MIFASWINETNIHASIQIPSVGNIISLCKYPFIEKTIAIKCDFLIDIYLTDFRSPMSKPTL